MERRGNSDARGGAVRWLREAPFDKARRALLADRQPARICRWCGSPAAPGRRSWCSDDCQREFFVRANSSDAARYVFERDQGVCALCSLDTARMKTRLWNIRARLTDVFRQRSGDGWERWKRIVRALRRKGWHDPVCESLWQVDHIVPVVEGGGCCGLEGLRTLCVPCHKAETAALARRRAK